MVAGPVGRGAGRGEPRLRPPAAHRHRPGAEPLGPEEFLQGAALLLRREAFDAVGGFDERFFMYGEDADLCERLRVAG